MVKKFVFAIFIFAIFFTAFFFTFLKPSLLPRNALEGIYKSQPVLNPTQPPNPKKLILPPMPAEKTLVGGSHFFQTFNNCGPASLAMALSFYGINISQKEIGDELRPYQVKNGDNDDKSVTLSELAKKSEDYGFIPYHRPLGDINLIKKFISIEIPVITRTLTKTSEDIGHFRVVYGYDDKRGELIQNDSLQGKALRFSYSDFLGLWKPYGYEFLVLIPEEKVHDAEIILGAGVNETTAWLNFSKYLEGLLKINPNDVQSRLSLSVSYYNIGNFSGSVLEFEKIQRLLSFRTLWYQIEPIKSYYQLGHYDRVLSLTSHIIENGNRAFSELYIIRGDVFLNQGNTAGAEAEYKKAVYYNANLKEAKERLSLIAI